MAGAHVPGVAQLALREGCFCLGENLFEGSPGGRLGVMGFSGLLVYDLEREGRGLVLRASCRRSALGAEQCSSGNFLPRLERGVPALAWRKACGAEIRNWKNAKSLARSVRPRNALKSPWAGNLRPGRPLPPAVPFSGAFRTRPAEPVAGSSRVAGRRPKSFTGMAQYKPISRVGPLNRKPDSTDGGLAWFSLVSRELSAPR